MKNKVLSVILALTVALTVLSGVGFTVSAEKFTEGDFTYTVTDGEATLTFVDKSVSGNVVIPSTLGGYPVTKIGGYVFDGRTNVTGVSIPDTVTTLGHNVFFGCTALESIVIPDSVTSTGNNLFNGCTSLSSVTIGKSLTSINDYLFYGCTAIKEITLPDSIAYIREYAFNRCTGLEKIKFSQSLQSIGIYAFYGCTSLESITIPDSVKVIDNYSFCQCTSLSSVEFGKSVTSIGISAFSECSALESIEIPDSVTSIGGTAFGECFSLKTASVGKSVKKIGDFAFSSCTSLEAVDIFGQITTLGSGTFSSCNTLEILLLPASLKSVGPSAFPDCFSLETILFLGTEKQLDDMEIAEGNDRLFEIGWICLGFPDVDYNQWYGDAIAFNVASGLMTGYGNGRFGTADGIQRQDFIVILSRISGDDIASFAGKANFKDVPKNAYYTNALAWAKATGVSSGYENGKFGVGDKVTREQIMTFLHNFTRLGGYDVSVTDDQKNEIRNLYPDFADVSDFAKDATFWALSRGVISGKDAGGGKKLIAPKATAKRCEVAAMFYNIFENDIFATE